MHSGKGHPERRGAWEGPRRVSAGALEREGERWDGGTRMPLHCIVARSSPELLARSTRYALGNCRACAALPRREGKTMGRPARPLPKPGPGAQPKHSAPALGAGAP